MGRILQTLSQIWASSEIPPRLVIILQVDASRHFQIWRDVRGRVSLLCPSPISEPRKTIIRLHVRVLPVFPPRFSSNPGDMSSTAWPQSVDPTLRPPPVGPRTAILTEDCAREERIAIFYEVVRCLLLGYKRSNVLVGYFAQYLGYVCCLRLGCAVLVRLCIA